jgi:hypothetical protein
LTAQK